MNIFRSSLFLLLSASLAAQTVTPRARAIHNSAIVVDTHADTPQRFLYENFDIGNTDPKDIGHISLDKARAGNLGAEFFSIWADPETTSGHFAKSTFDMANSGPNTNGSQFFITIAPTQWLTGKHTIFGEVVEGYEVAEKIVGTPRNRQDKPLKDAVVKSVVIEKV